MMPRVIRSFEAEMDLLRLLFKRGFEVSYRSAVRLATEIDRKAQRYAGMPLIGILRDDLLEHLRCFPVRPYLVFYRPLPDHDGIEIVRILHDKLNITGEFF